MFERRDMFRFLIKKGVSGKIKIVRDLSACVIQKFNGYEISNVKFKCEQKKLFYPVYEPITKRKSIICYYPDDLALVYRTRYSQKVKRKKFNQ